LKFDQGFGSEKLAQRLTAHSGFSYCALKNKFEENSFQLRYGQISPESSPEPQLTNPQFFPLSCAQFANGRILAC
jgi:hypothetical protein